MEEFTTERRVLEIVSKISGKEITPHKINMNGLIREELALDSIQIVELFVSLESVFGIELPLQMMTVRTCKEFVELLNIEVNKSVHV